MVSLYNMKERNYIFDAIKALAIWLVVLGHCVQYLSGVDFRNDGLYQFIYSFHMPLFFMVSGFFCSSSMKLTLWEFLRKKSIALLFPCFVWGILDSCLHFHSWEILVVDILLPTHWPFWFFKTLFIVQLVAYISQRIALWLCDKEQWSLALAILMSMTVALIPYLGMARIMIPMFWIGYFINKYYKQFVQYHRIIAILTSILYICLFGLWYWGIHSDAQMTELVLKMYKRMLAVTGSVAIISAMHELKARYTYLSLVGTSTAGIYILQTFIIEKGAYFLFPKYIDLSNISLLLNYILMLVISLLLVVFITWMYKYLCKNKYLALIFFGHEQGITSQK